MQGGLPIENEDISVLQMTIDLFVYGSFWEE